MLVEQFSDKRRSGSVSRVYDELIPDGIIDRRNFTVSGLLRRGVFGLELGK